MIMILTISESLSQKWVTLSDTVRTYKLRQEISFLWDKKNEYQISEIQSPDLQNQFSYSGKKALNLGISDKHIWFKIQVKNTDLKRKDWILEIAYPHYDSLQFFYQNDKGEWTHHLTGDKTPFYTRQIFNKYYAYPIHFSDTSLKTFYFNIGGEGSIQFPIYFHTQEYYYSAQEKINVVYGGLFFGVITIMLVYNLFIFFSLRDKSYLLYVLTNASVLLFYLGYSGYGFQYLWSDYYFINSKIIPYGVILTGFTTTLFIRSFLDTKFYSPWLDKAAIVTMATYCIAAAIVAFSSYELSLKLVTALAALSSLLILITSYRVLHKGNKSARFIALAFSFYLVGILLLTSNILGIIPRSFIAAHAMEIGTVIELTLLSLALSDKYSRLRIEKEKAQSELIEMQKKINEELEKKVEERTQQLNRQKLELQDSNRVKDKLLSIISHDLKGPLNAFQSLLSMMLKDDPTPEKINMYALHLNNKLSTMVGLVDNILHWVRSQMKGIKIDIQVIRLKDLVVENVSLFSSQAELKKITIDDQVSEGIEILGDKNIVRLVIRNLIANALKFTGNEGNVTILATQEGNSVCIEVRDTGVGMNEQKMNKLFTEEHFTSPDTDQKEGTGLGLLLCKEFLTITNGKIWAESEEGKGSVFKFTLPTATKEKMKA